MGAGPKLSQYCLCIKKQNNVLKWKQNKNHCFAKHMHSPCVNLYVKKKQNKIGFSFNLIV